MLLSVKHSVVARTTVQHDGSPLCPSCGSRPHWAATVTRHDEVIEQAWWCPQCFAFMKSVSAAVPVPHVVNYYLGGAMSRMN